MSDRDMQKMILDNARLRANQLQHCRGCGRVKLHPCGAFHWCDRLGAVDLDRDGCSKREEG